MVTDAPWQIIDKKRKGAKIEAAAEVETLNIQPGFVTAKGSVPVNSGKKQKHEEAEIEIEITKIKKEVQIEMDSDYHLLDLYGMVIIIVVHTMLCLQYCLKSGPLM